MHLFLLPSHRNDKHCPLQRCQWTYPCYRGSEMMVVSSVIPQLSPNMTFGEAFTKSSITVYNPGTSVCYQLRYVCPVNIITKTCLFKYIENFTSNNWIFSDKKLWYFFHISTQNIDCGYLLEPPRRGGSNAYPQSMFLSRNKKNNVYPRKPQFTI